MEAVRVGEGRRGEVLLQTRWVEGLEGVCGALKGSKVRGGRE